MRSRWHTHPLIHPQANTVANKESSRVRSVVVETSESTQSSGSDEVGVGLYADPSSEKHGSQRSAVKRSVAPRSALYRSVSSIARNVAVTQQRGGSAQRCASGGGGGGEAGLAWPLLQVAG